MKKNKVLFLIHDLSGGGAEKVLVNLVNHIDKTRFEVHLTALFAGGVNEKNISPDVHYKTVWKKAIPGNSHLMKFLTPKQLHRICVKGHYDVEISYLEGPSARIISGCKDPSTALLCWIHGTQHDRKQASSAFRSFHESEECYGKFDRIVCVSEDIRSAFSNIYLSLSDKSCVRYNTNETDRILKLADESVDGRFLDDNSLKLVAVGKICKLKGFDRLARIVKRLRDDGLPVHLYALGSGPDQAEIEAYLSENGLTDYYTFLGYQTNPYKYVAKCNLFVCASHSEGFSTAATEALIVGTPVCTVEVSGMKEMLGENDEWGVVTKNDDEALYRGIKRLISDSSLLKRYKEKAIQRGKAFSTENTVKAVESLLENTFRG